MYSLSKVTKPKPRDLDVLGSFITMQSTTLKRISNELPQNGSAVQQSPNVTKVLSLFMKKKTNTQSKQTVDIPTKYFPKTNINGNWQTGFI